MTSGEVPYESHIDGRVSFALTFEGWISQGQQCFGLFSEKRKDYLTRYFTSRGYKISWSVGEHKLDVMNYSK